jgi:hypothetical protein
MNESIRMKNVNRLKISQILDFSSKSSLIAQQCSKIGSMILTEFRRNNEKLLHRGSRDGFKASNFQQKCENERNTLTLIVPMKNFIFGGLTLITWKSSASSLRKTDNSGKGFLFHLKNARTSESRKFILKNGRNAIYWTTSRGPYFEYHLDIFMYDNCYPSVNNCTDLGRSHVNNTGIDGKFVFTGEKYFTKKEIEAFTTIL